jgi:phage-related protein
LLELLAINGNKLSMPYSKPLKENLLELRCKTQEGQERIIYCFVKGKICILLHAFLKKTNKTPENELNIALERYKDLQKRFNV